MKKASLALLLVLLAASSLQAYFDRLEVGGRALAMGKAFHALADDPSAVYWNPAGFAWQRRAAVLVTHYRPYVVDDLSSNFAALTFPLPGPIGTAGFGWHHTAISDVMAEDLFAFSLARRADLPVVGDLGLGLTAKFFRVGYDGFRDLETGEDVDFGSQTKFTADLGAILQPVEKIRVGVIARNLGEPVFDFVDGEEQNHGTPMESELEGSLSFLWNEASVISLGFAQNREKELQPTIGSEVLFYDVFALRSGIFDFEFWGGFGIQTAAWFFDAGFATHKDLGVSYMVSVTVPFGRER